MYLDGWIVWHQTKHSKLRVLSFITYLGTLPRQLGSWTVGEKTGQCWLTLGKKGADGLDLLTFWPARDLLELQLELDNTQ